MEKCLNCGSTDIIEIDDISIISLDNIVNDSQYVNTLECNNCGEVITNG